MSSGARRYFRRISGSNGNSGLCGSPAESYCRYYKKAEEAYPSINSSEYEQQLLEGIRLADKDMAYDAVNRLIRSLKENPLEDAGEVKFENRLINQEETSVCLIRNCM